MNINWIAILAAAVAAWTFGAAWLAVFGRPRVSADVAKADASPEGARTGSIAPMIVSFIAKFIMALILAGVIAHTAKKGLTIGSGALVAAICWLGFVITTLATNHAYSRTKPLRAVIDGGHWLGVLLIQGIVLGAML